MMTRSESVYAVVDQTGDGEWESSFVVVSWDVDEGNMNPESFRAAVDVEEVMRLSVVFERDSQSFHRFWFDFCFCSYSCFFPFSCSCSCSCSCSSLFPCSSSSSFSDLNRISWVIWLSSVHPLSYATLAHSDVRTNIFSNFVDTVPILGLLFPDRKTKVHPTKRMSLKPVSLDQS